MGIRYRKPRAAIGDDTCARIERAVAAGKHHRYRDDARQETTKIGDDEIESRSEQQQGTITDLTVSQSCRHVAGATIELCKCQNGFFIPLIGQENAGAVVRLLRSPMTKQIDEGGEERGPTRVEHLTDLTSRAALRHMTLSNVSRKFSRRRIFEYGFSRKLDPEPLFELHEKK